MSIEEDITNVAQRIHQNMTSFPPAENRRFNSRSAAGSTLTEAQAPPAPPSRQVQKVLLMDAAADVLSRIQNIELDLEDANKQIAQLEAKLASERERNAELRSEIRASNEKAEQARNREEQWRATTVHLQTVMATAGNTIADGLREHAEATTGINSQSRSAE